MDFNQALIFVKIVELGGFGAAADSLAMPKSTVSKKLSNLEARLETKLLNRTTRRVWPTEAGLRYYAHCAAALQELKGAEEELQSMQNLARGMLRVGAQVTIGMSYLTPMVTDFLKLYPEVQITLLLVGEGIEMARNNIDLLIRVGDMQESGYSMRRLFSAKSGLFATPDYLDRHGSPQSVPDLADHEAITYIDAGSSNERVWELHSSESGVTSCRIRKHAPRFMGNDPGTVLIATLGGLGIGELPLRLVEDKVREGQLVRVLPDWELPTADMNVYLITRSCMSLKGRLFADFMIDWFRRLDIGGHGTIFQASRADSGS